MPIINPKLTIESYCIRGKDVNVVREDLSTNDPAPRLAKLRGVYKNLLKAKEQGYKQIGVFDTRVSKAGWGCAAIAQEIGDTKIVNFYPDLKEYKGIPPENQQKVLDLGGKLYGLKGGRTAVLYSQAKRICEANNWFMMPMGLVVQESVESTRELAETLPREILGGDMVICVGSGMITAGIAAGASKNLNKIYAISAGMNNAKQKKRIESVIGELPENLILTQSKYGYYDKCEIDCPFDSSIYYDKKAWEWLLDHIEELKQPIIFWNVGV